MSKSKKSLILIIFTWCVAILALTSVISISAWSVLTKPMSNVENELSLKVKVLDGASIKSVSRDLQDKDLIRSWLALYLAARFNLFSIGNEFCLKSGVYNIKSSMSLKEIYNLLQSGKQEYISVSIPEGLTKSKIASILEKNEVCNSKEFIDACFSQELLNKFNIEAESFEGFLFPDTYFFNPGMAAEDVIDIMVNNFFNKIKTIEKLNSVDFKSLYNKLILASIIEREYRLAEEAPLISSVFTNRLKYNIGLYSCATVEYIITEINGLPHPDVITYKDLKSENPYNTYKWAGLTPGPISNPGLIALDAAVNPAKTDYFFFVLTDPASGKHTFSKNFDQHKEVNEIKYYSKKGN